MLVSAFMGREFTLDVYKHAVEENIVSSPSVIQCSFMKQRLIIIKKSNQILDNLKGLPTKPKLLLHACCGPCSLFPLTYLCLNF